MAKAKYPLKEVLEIKQKRVDEAEKVLQEKRRVLEAEETKLKQVEVERDKVKEHKKDKLKQLREEMDHGTTSPKIQQMKSYLKIVDEKLIVEERKVKEQKDKVEKAKKEVEAAKEQLRIKRMEVDKLQTHKTSWEKQTKREDDIKEEREMDELGTVIHEMNVRKNEIFSRGSKE